MRRVERDLAELGLESVVDLIKGTAESGELFASLIGDDKLGHAIPVNVPRCLEGNIDNFLGRSAHFIAHFLTNSPTFSVANRSD